MKLNWGHYLTITMIVFIAFIIGLITLIGGNKDSLVEEGYYEKGLNHDETMKREANTMSYKDEVSVKYLGGNIELDLPDSMTVQNVRLLCMRPDDQSKDQSFLLKELTPNQAENGNTATFRKLLEPGLYKTTVLWEADSLGYLVEQDLFVQ